MTSLSEAKITEDPPLLRDEALRQALAELPLWDLTADGRAICREWRFKTFRRAAALVNLAAWQAEAGGHHPEIAFGWGHASITYTTHSAGGVTMNDLIMAARLDAASA
ncbi:4a-hydroxytetrahydrobiopterin dehydratase [Paracoccus sp. (in: a-proteobacteria)]|uniref:4a-hydroxytetrahydrobiopterin dehydratase n=1 Tax=Paracoccus sp. TaxID=267 RepID=UPI00321FFDBF